MAYALPLLLPAAGRSAARRRRSRRPPRRRRCASSLTNGSFVLLVLYFTLPALAGWVVRDWMPAILKQQFGIGQGQAGVSATLYWQLAAIVGAIAGGSLADRWMRRTPRGRIFASAVGMASSSPPSSASATPARSPRPSSFLALFGLGWGFFDCNNMPILCQIVRPELRATGYGIMNLVSISCGGFADWGFGALRDAHVPLDVDLRHVLRRRVALRRPRPPDPSPAGAGRRWRIAMMPTRHTGRAGGRRPDRPEPGVGA